MASHFEKYFGEFEVIPLLNFKCEFKQVSVGSAEALEKPFSVQEVCK